MRITTLVSILLSLLLALVALPATASEQPGGVEPQWQVSTSEGSSWQVTGSDTVKSGRDFMKQGFTFTTNIVNEVDITACKDGLCFDLWRADTHVKKEHETDFQVWKAIPLGTATFTAKVAYYELAGPDVENLTLTVSHPLSAGCSIEGSYEKDWGGFKEDAWQAKGSCTRSLGTRVAIDGSLQLSHSKNFAQWVPAGEIGTSFTLNDHLGLRPFARGFLGRNPHAFVGVTLSVH